MSTTIGGGEFAADAQKKSAPKRMLPRSMPTIEIVNQKGGSAKTAVASHTIFRAVGRNLRTLAIDFDKQASLTSFFNVQAGEGYATSAQCFDGPIAAVPVKCGNYLDFLPADRALRMCSGAGAEAALHAAANAVARMAIVGGKTLRAIAEQHGWTQNAVRHGTEQVWKQIVHLRQSWFHHGSQVTAETPPGWIQMAVPAELVDAFRSQIEQWKSTSAATPDAAPVRKRTRAAR
ncbi:hypothetical protein PT2222_540002 [Paraburkholderia tropica]